MRLPLLRPPTSRVPISKTRQVRRSFRPPHSCKYTPSHRLCCKKCKLLKTRTQNRSTQPTRFPTSSIRHPFSPSSIHRVIIIHNFHRVASCLKLKNICIFRSFGGGGFALYNTASFTRYRQLRSGQSRNLNVSDIPLLTASFAVAVRLPLLHYPLFTLFSTSHLFLSLHPSIISSHIRKVPSLVCFGHVAP